MTTNVVIAIHVFQLVGNSASAEELSQLVIFPLMKVVPIENIRVKERSTKICSVNRFFSFFLRYRFTYQSNVCSFVMVNRLRAEVNGHRCTNLSPTRNFWRSACCRSLLAEEHTYKMRKVLKVKKHCLRTFVNTICFAFSHRSFRRGFLDVADTLVYCGSQAVCWSKWTRGI